jgi:hypothetical protein
MHWFAQVHEFLAGRRMAATALALRLFAQENARPAASLDELVPGYLPAVPIDPLDPAGRPIRALLSADKPRLYSVGKNRKDNDGEFAADDYRGERLDLVFFLRPGDRPELQPERSPSTPKAK